MLHFSPKIITVTRVYVCVFHILFFAFCIFSSAESQLFLEWLMAMHDDSEMYYSGFMQVCICCSLYGLHRQARSTSAASVTAWWYAELKLDELYVRVNTGMVIF